MYVLVRNELLVSLDFFDVSNGNAVVVGDPPIKVTITPEAGGPAGRASAEVIEAVGVSAALLTELRAIPPDKAIGICPPAVEAFAKPIGERHRSASACAVELIRWRLRCDGDHRAVSGLGATEWSEDGIHWGQIPRDLRPSGKAYVAPDLPVASIEQMSQNGVSEPVGHALLREAIGNLYANPRSSLVVGVAALEVGLKEAIADLDPVAGWLAQNAPSPPIRRMFRDFVPLLPVRVPDGWRLVPPPHSVLKRIDAAVEARNDIVHLGSGEFSRADLEPFLDLVGDLLYLLDFCRGQSWAVSRIHDQAIVNGMRRGA